MCTWSQALQYEVFFIHTSTFLQLCFKLFDIICWDLCFSHILKTVMLWAVIFSLEKSASSDSGFIHFPIKLFFRMNEYFSLFFLFFLLGGNIPVGIAIARQRVQQEVIASPTLPPTGLLTTVNGGAQIKELARLSEIGKSYNTYYKWFIKILYNFLSLFWYSDYSSYLYIELLSLLLKKTTKKLIAFFINLVIMNFFYIQYSEFGHKF